MMHLLHDASDCRTWQHVSSTTKKKKLGRPPTRFIKEEPTRFIKEEPTRFIKEERIKPKKRVVTSLEEERWSFGFKWFEETKKRQPMDEEELILTKEELILTKEELVLTKEELIRTKEELIRKNEQQLPQHDYEEEEPWSLNWMIEEECWASKLEANFGDWDIAA